MEFKAGDLVTVWQRPSWNKYGYVVWNHHSVELGRSRGKHPIGASPGKWRKSCCVLVPSIAFPGSVKVDPDAGFWSYHRRLEPEEWLAELREAGRLNLQKADEARDRLWCSPPCWVIDDFGNKTMNLTPAQGAQRLSFWELSSWG